MGNSAICVKAPEDGSYFRDSFSEKLALDEMSLFRKMKSVESDYQNTLKLDGHVVIVSTLLEGKYALEYNVAYEGQVQK